MTSSGGAGEDLAGEADAVAHVGDRGDGGSEVERARVVGDVFTADGGCFGSGRIAKIEPQIPENLIGAVEPAFPGGGGEALVHELLGLDVTLLGEEAADLGEAGVGVGTVVNGDAAGPHAGLVEHDAFAGGVAEEHGPEASVADGAGLGEMARGGLEAQNLGVRGGGDIGSCDAVTCGGGGREEKGCHGEKGGRAGHRGA